MSGAALTPELAARWALLVEAYVSSGIEWCHFMEIRAVYGNGRALRVGLYHHGRNSLCSHWGEGDASSALQRVRLELLHFNLHPFNSEGP